MILVAGSLTAFYLAFEMDFKDRYYHKFTRPSTSMIVGSSRALLGLDPASISAQCPQAKEMLNFAFTLRTSPYGKVYYDAIDAKLSPGVTGGVFIVEVSPLNISSGENELPEKRLILGELKFFNLDPNPEYVLRAAEHPLYLDMFQNWEPPAIQSAHPDGWLENLKVDDSVRLAKKLVTQRREYVQIFQSNRISDYRIKWLEKTIQLLKGHGTVVLLRMPVIDEMHQMEQAYCPQFDTMMENLARNNGVTYLDLSSNSGYSFLDMHHMISESAKSYSSNVGRALCGIADRSRNQN